MYGSHASSREAVQVCYFHRRTGHHLHGALTLFKGYNSVSDCTLTMSIDLVYCLSSVVLKHGFAVMDLSR